MLLRSAKEERVLLGTAHIFDLRFIFWDLELDATYYYSLLIPQFVGYQRYYAAIILAESILLM